MANIIATGKTKIKNSNLFLLPGNPHMLHLATVGMGLREFVAFLCWLEPAGVLRDKTPLGNVYIEEAVLTSKDYTKDVFANLKFIEEDELAFDIAKTLEELKLLDIVERGIELNANFYKGLRSIMFELSKNKDNLFFPNSAQNKLIVY